MRTGLPPSTRYFPGLFAVLLAVAPACSVSSEGTESTSGSSGGAGRTSSSSGGAAGGPGGSSASSSTLASSAGASAGASGGSSGGAAAGSGGTSSSASKTGGATTSGGSAGSGGRGGTSGGSGGTSKASGGTLGGTVGGASGGTVSGGTTSSQTSTTPKGGTPAITGHYQMEDLDRGVVAVKVSSGVYVGWRMLGYEYDPQSPTSVSYNVYRDGTKLASVTDSTNYLDASGTANSAYTVTAVINGNEGEQSPKVTVWGQSYIKIPLTPPGSGYEANDASPGDLDGDGQYEIVLKWQPDNAQDNSKPGVTSNTYLDGLKLNGTRLWRIDLGPNIRSGAHYTQHVVYDFDGDGKAELAVKTAPGSKDGKGAFLKIGPAANDDDSKKYANSDGYILSGPEYLTVFDGATGAELATVDYPVLRGTVSSWGDDYGNRLDRFNAGAAFVKDGGGKTASGLPSIIEQRGYYTRMTVSAYTWRAGKLEKNWIFDSNGSGNGKAEGQGNHTTMVADVDGDGAQEIIPGATTINSNGTLRCVTGLGHGDALHVSEHVPGKGISVFMPHEGDGGYDLHDGSTCAILFKAAGEEDNGRGVAADISPSNPGAEFWTSKFSPLYSASSGASVGNKPGPTNFLIFWDADESRELLDGATISKLGVNDPLLAPNECAGNNGTKNTPTLTADLLGDWREELVVRETNNQALRVYTTTAVTKRRIYTLMHDPTYRMQVSFEQASYNQPPHPGFHIGSGMKDPPKPDIFVK